MTSLSEKSDKSGSRRVKVAAFTSGASGSPTFHIHDQLLKSFQHVNAEVSSTRLLKTKLNTCDGCFAAGGRTCLFPCDYNDIDSDIYDPEDKGVLVHESVTECDVLVLTVEARGGGLDCEAQRFVERLVPYQNLLHKQGRNLLDGKVAVIAIVGAGAEAVAGQLTARLAALGFSIAPRGVVSVELPHVSRESGMKIVSGSNHVAALLQAAAENSAYVARKLAHT